MKWSRPIGLLLIALCMVHSMPTQSTTTTTTTRSTPSIGNSTKNVANQQGDNSTALDMVLDIRTPPKVKQQVQNKMKIKHEVENSHAGVAIPIDEDALEIEETTKKLNFYKIERPTTNSGLSTWILLSGQESATTKLPSTRKPIIKPTSQQQNVTVAATDKPTRVVKPLFKQRSTTTTTKATTTTTEPTTTTVKNTTRLTKVKASALNSANKKLNSTNENSTKKTHSTTSATTVKSVSTTHVAVKKNITESTTISALNSSSLPLESKNTEVDLPNTDSKKKKTTAKRKKNKTRRRKPGDKDANSTSIAKPTKNHKDKPIGTQLYNYLAREIMPTVGVGLVGLMVTAGLASYFLYPFGALRRNDIDRKDKEGSYYYNDDYSGGMPEEEAIGKVIAGMPGNSLFENSYKSPSSRKAYLNSKYRLSDRRAQIQRNAYGGMVQGSVENVPLTSTKQENENVYEKSNQQGNNYEPMLYPSSLDATYSSGADSKYVVGNVPKEVVTEVTPAAVPEHGPRNLNIETHYAEEPIFVVGNVPQEFLESIRLGRVPAKKPRNLQIRRKRDIPNDTDNEIVPSLDNNESTTNSNIDESYVKDTTVMTTDLSSQINTTKKPETTTNNTETTTNVPDKVNSFIDLMKELIHVKASLGLQMIQNATKSISNYISRIQTRLDQHYRHYSKNKH